MELLELKNIILEKLLDELNRILKTTEDWWIWRQKMNTPNWSTGRNKAKKLDPQWPVSQDHVIEHICNWYCSSRKERRRNRKQIFEERIAENFPYLS